MAASCRVVQAREMRRPCGGGQNTCGVDEAVQAVFLTALDAKNESDEKMWSKEHY